MGHNFLVITISNNNQQYWQTALLSTTKQQGNVDIAMFNSGTLASRVPAKGIAAKNACSPVSLGNKLEWVNG
jgi:2',3'-cyclic-nucleotide 2'-phosphodiesterase (5'-nucleotidase family)